MTNGGYDHDKRIADAFEISRTTRTNANLLIDCWVALLIHLGQSIRKSLNEIDLWNR